MASFLAMGEFGRLLWITCALLTTRGERHLYWESELEEWFMRRRSAQQSAASAPRPSDRANSTGQIPGQGAPQKNPEHWMWTVLLAPVRVVRWYFELEKRDPFIANILIPTFLMGVTFLAWIVVLFSG